MNIDTVLEEWNNAKERKAYYEKECDKYKDAVERYMNKKESDKISGRHYSVNRRHTTRQTISKKSVPVDVWNKYSVRTTYDSYYISKNK